VNTVLLIIIVAAVVVLAVLLFGAKKGRDKRRAGKRMEAQELRQGADVESAKAQRARAEAEEAAARAERTPATSTRTRTVAVARSDRSIWSTAARNVFPSDAAAQGGGWSARFEGW
jgi:hypothetical protein